MTLYGKYSKRMFPSIVNFDKAHVNINILKLSSKIKKRAAMAHEEKMKKLQTILPYAKLHYLPFKSLVIQEATSSNSYQVLPNYPATVPCCISTSTSKRRIRLPMREVLLLFWDVSSNAPENRFPKRTRSGCQSMSVSKLLSKN